MQTNRLQPDSVRDIRAKLERRRELDAERKRLAVELSAMQERKRAIMAELATLPRVRDYVRELGVSKNAIINVVERWKHKRVR